MKSHMLSLFCVFAPCIFLPISVSAVELENLTPYSIDMHLHGFSNHNAGPNPASMEFHSEQAILTKFAEVLWWSDHTRAFDQWSPFSFDLQIARINTSLDIVGLPPVRTSNTSFLEAISSGGTPAARLESGTVFFQLQSDADINDFQFFSYEAKNSRHSFGRVSGFKFNRPLFSQPVVDIEMECDNPDVNTICEVEFGLAWHHDGETPVQQILTYRIDSQVVDRRAELLSPSHVQVTIPPQTGGHYFFKLLDDAMLMKNGDDNTIVHFILRVGARLGALGNMSFRGITILSDKREDFQQLEAVNNIAQRYEAQYGLREPVGLEFGTSEGHLNGFFSKSLNKNDLDLFDVVKGERQPFGGITTWASIVHDKNGLVTLNHPFGPSTGCGLLLPDDCVRVRATKLLEKNAYGADLMEVGYVLRGLGLQGHLDLWDILTSNKLFLYGTAASDNHGVQWQRYRRYVTWVLSPSSNANDLIGSLRAGHVFFGNPKVWKGTFTFRVNDAFMGDRILNPGGISQVTFNLDPWPETVKVYLVQGLIKPGMNVEYVHNRTLLTQNQIIEIDTSRPSFVRLEAYDNFDKLGDLKNAAMFTNPIVMLPELSSKPSIPGGSSDSNKDGLSDVDAIALLLNPRAPNGDTDGDSISDVIEVGNFVTQPLDNDLDGVIDAIEPGATASNATIASNLPLSNGLSVNIITASGELLTKVNSSILDETITEIESLIGVVSYTTTSPINGEMVIQLVFSADLFEELALYQLDSTGSLVQLSSSIWKRINARTIEVSVKDGNQITDLDKVADGSIVNSLVITPTLASAAIPTPTTPTPTPAGNSSGGSVTISIILFLLLIPALRIKRSS